MDWLSARRRRFFRRLLAYHAAFGLAGCAIAEIDHGGHLSSYRDLTRSDGLATKAEINVVPQLLSAAKTATIVPTAFADPSPDEALDDSQRALIANEIDRSLCQGLSTRFTMVSGNAQADLIVHATVTRATPTSVAAAGVSKVASIVPSIVAPTAHAYVPRLPFGLGSLNVEAEALDTHNRQVGAMVWARGADAITSKARLSSDGDAYDLASEFSNDFTKLIVTGEDPFHVKIAMPSWDGLKDQVGFGDMVDVCKSFGSRPGLLGIAGGVVGLPPSWTDSGRTDAP